MMSASWKNRLCGMVILLLAACSGVSPAQPTPTVSSPPTQAAPGNQAAPADQAARSSTPPPTSFTPSTSPGVSLPGTTAPGAATEPVSDTTAGASGAGIVQIAELSFQPWELVNAIDWSPDGETLAVAAGPAVYLLSSRDLSRLGYYETGALTHSLDFNPQGDRLAAGSRDGLIRLWDLSTGPGPGGAGELAEPLLTIEAHKKGVNCVLFSPDGRRLASGGNDAMVRLWDAGTGEEVGNIIGGTFSIPSIAYSPDGALLAIVNGDVIRFREVESGRIKGTLRAETTFYSSAISPDGEILAVGDTANTIRNWRLAQAFSGAGEAAPAEAVLSGHEGLPGSPSALIWRLAFNPDGDLLASAGGDGSIRLWELRTAELVATLNGHKGGATSLAFSPDGRRLASGGLDASLRLWGAK